MAGRGGRQVFVRYEDGSTEMFYTITEFMSVHRISDSALWRYLDGTTKKPRFMKVRGIASIDVGGIY